MQVRVSNTTEVTLFALLSSPAGAAGAGGRSGGGGLLQVPLLTHVLPAQHTSTGYLPQHAAPLGGARHVIPVPRGAHGHAVLLRVAAAVVGRVVLPLGEAPSSPVAEIVQPI